MQISSNHTGFQFSSVYKSVVTRQQVPREENSTAGYQASIQSSAEADADKLQREAQVLRAAQRAADRTAGLFATASEL